jgi:hypothetical protein
MPNASSLAVAELAAELSPDGPNSVDTGAAK